MATTALIEATLLNPGDDRLYSTLFGLGVILLTIPMAVGTYWLHLRLMDWALGINFRDEYKKLTPAARGAYLGRRNIGVAIVIGCVYLRFL